MNRNIELKCRYPNLELARELAERRGARFAARLEQTDTYFQVPSGRLKLRQISGAAAELISYARGDSAEFRDSHYILVPAPHPDLLLAALSSTCGVRGRIVKTRDLLLFDNIRIHLDRVSGLGHFLEFEAVIGPSDDPRISRQKLDELHQVLRIDPANHCTGSYIDLLNP